MDFISSISFPNEPLISCTFLDHFCHHFCVGLVLLYCCNHPKMMMKMAKKCSTDQSCIRKEVTSYKIHTLVIIRYLWCPQKQLSESRCCCKCRSLVSVINRKFSLQNCRVKLGHTTL